MEGKNMKRFCLLLVLILGLFLAGCAEKKVSVPTEPAPQEEPERIIPGPLLPGN
jgi:hypothetical protein